MPNFRYVARNQAGQDVSGVLVAANQGVAVTQLRGENLTVLSVEQEKARRLRLFGGPPRPRVKTEDMVVFTRQLATMISSGIPLLEALEILQEQVSDKGFKAVLGNVVERIRGGSDLSAALGEYPKLFPDIYVNMVKAGEASGQLDEILVRLAEYQEATAQLKREIKAAMTYPVISLVMVLGITIFLMVGIVPRFKEIFEGFGNLKLPGVTRFVLAVSLSMKHYFFFWFLGMIGLVILVVLYTRTEKGSRQWDWLKLKLPVFGTLFQKVALSRFSRTFATLLRSGVPILGALEIVAGTAGNRIVSSAVLSARENVRQGETLADPLAESPVFPPMVTRMIAIGERSGAMESLLEKISEFYDQQVQATVQSLTALIEPLMIAIMGVFVGGIVLSIFLPIIRLQQALSGK
jgi:type IV pilus assembly protein PilC